MKTMGELGFDLSDISPGIRQLVRRLNDAGFVTTDSGDGVTNVEEGMECAMDFANVHMHCDAAEGIAAAHDLFGIVSGWCGRTLPENAVQLTYDPSNKVAMLSLYMIDDSDLRESN